MLNPIDLSIEAVLRNAIEYLSSDQVKNSIDNHIENPRLEAELLLSHVLGSSRSQILIHSDRIISREEFSKFESLLEKKLTQIPTAYLIGRAGFFGREFYVNSSVLIPRPETEELLEWVMASSHSFESILDLCTGSGCIGLTLACELKLKYLCLSDRSAAALETAKKNTDFFRNLLRGSVNRTLPEIALIQSDLFNNMLRTDFDLIVSNPPYVLTEEYEYLDKNVKDFEPREALILESPAEFNKRLIQGAYQHLNSSGMIYLESSPVLMNSLLNFFEIYGFVNIEIKKDLSGKDRFIRAQKP